MRRLSSVIALQAYALLLALVQLQGAVRTDEAKYLLNIPYPHPPLARGLFSLLDACPYQELIVRLLLATLAVQSAWLVWAMGRRLSKYDRLALCGSWLFAWGIVSQAGTVMMAPLTALQGLVFAWLYVRDQDETPYAGLIALFWLASLFTAYQAALFFPVVLALLWRTKLPAWQRLALFSLPVALLCLYTLTNPFALASMLSQAGKDGTSTLFERSTSLTFLWFAAGSGVLSVAGTAGLLASKRIALILSFLLVCAYIFVGYHGYYIVLFVPFFVAGLSYLLLGRARWGRPYAVLFCLGAIFFIFTKFHAPAASPAREAIRIITARGNEGILLMEGSFGHEWQYESSIPVYRYTESLLPQAQAVVCLKEPCAVRGNPAFLEFPDMPVGLWMKQ